VSKCGTCTACCEVFEIKELSKPVNTLCSNCTGEGCGIHGKHPDECKQFECEFIRGGWKNELLRPDKSGVIISWDAINKRFQAIQFKDKIKQAILDQINFIRQQGVEIVEVNSKNLA